VKHSKNDSDLRCSVHLLLMTALLPSICQSRDFVFSTDFQALQYASNETLVFQLQDAVDVWISRCESVAADCDAAYAEADRDFDDLPAFVERLERLRNDSEFFRHFELNEPAAVLRVLKAKRDTSRLAKLDAWIKVLDAHHKQIDTCLSMLRDFVQLFTNENEWRAAMIGEVVRPILSCARAMWFCDPIFGRRHVGRFSRLLNKVIDKTHRVVEKYCVPLIPAAYGNPRRPPSGAVETILDCQEGVVALQEALCDLVAATGQDGVDVASSETFVYSDFLFHRLEVAIEIIEAIHRHPNKCGRLCTEFENLELFTTIMTTSDLIALLETFETQEPQGSTAVVQRIISKSYNRMVTVAPKVEDPARRLCVTLSIDEGRVVLYVQGATLIDLDVTEIETAFVGSFDLSSGTKDNPKPKPTAVTKGRGFLIDVSTGFVSEANEMKLLQRMLQTFESLGWKMSTCHSTSIAPSATVMIFQ
jgi:hypothetical protein